MTVIPYAWRLRLAAAFAQADQEGYGIAQGERFDAYPGMEDAAADRIEQIVKEHS